VKQKIPIVSGFGISQLLRAETLSTRPVPMPTRSRICWDRERDGFLAFAFGNPVYFVQDED
jgi:hypothetical protein